MPDMTQEQYDRCQQIATTFGVWEDGMRIRLSELRRLHNALGEDEPRTAYLDTCIDKLDECIDKLADAQRELTDMDKIEEKDGPG